MVGLCSKGLIPRNEFRQSVSRSWRDCTQTLVKPCDLGPHPLQMIHTSTDSAPEEKAYRFVKTLADVYRPVTVLRTVFLLDAVQLFQKRTMLPSAEFTPE